MKRNEGQLDRILRISVGIAGLGAGLYFGSWWGLVALVPLATGALGSCPVYTIFGINTCQLEAR